MTHYFFLGDSNEFLSSLMSLLLHLDPSRVFTINSDKSVLLPLDNTQVDLPADSQQIQIVSRFKCLGTSRHTRLFEIQFTTPVRQI